MSGQRPFGQVIAEHRTLLGLSPRGAARLLNLTPSLLEDLESGHVLPTPAIRQLFEATYTIDLSSTATRETGDVVIPPASYDEASEMLLVGNLGVRFRIGVDDNDVLFRGFSAAYRRAHRLGPAEMIRLGVNDMETLAALADLTDLDLDERARFWFGQDRTEGQSFSTLLAMSRPRRRDHDEQ